ncbi:MAG: hypothetical protein JWM44_2381 [Bacilli bacterium]|nr:hypothetical protein [Bacilli bacterium]
MMNDNLEKEMFKLIDQLDLRQEIKVLNSVEHAEEIIMDDEDIRRMKINTFAKLGLVPNDDIHPERALLRIVSLKKKWSRLLVASLLALVLLASFAMGSPEIRAQIRKVFQYIPGFASVQETEGQTILFVMPMPVVQKIGSGQLEIRGVSIGDKQSYVSLTGKNIAWLETITLRNEAGKSYVLSNSIESASSGEWTGSYYIEGAIQATDQMVLAYGDIAPSVPFQLASAKTVDRVQDLGVTQTHQGISLTAVTAPADGDKTKVTIIPQLPANMRIESFGISPIYNLAQAKLSANDHKEIPFEQDLTFPNPNEFYFHQGENKQGDYKLTLPALGVVRQSEQDDQITLPIPSNGVMMLNKQITILGFPVDLIRVERNPDDPNKRDSDFIRIYFDLHYDAASRESLLSFWPDFAILKKSGGAGEKSNETTKALEYMDLDVEHNAKEYTFYVKEAHTLVRGPWEFNLR